MDTHSIIIFGILSALVLIFACITLNVSQFYNELERSNISFKSTLNLKSLSKGF